MKFIKSKLARVWALLAVLGLSLVSSHASGGAAVPAEVTDSFSNAVSVVQAIGAAGLLVVAAWVVFMVAKKGLGMFGKG